MSPEGPRLLIRADADGRMGTGHVMRCLALAQCWMEHIGPVTLAAARLPDGLKTRLEDDGVAVAIVGEEIADTCRLAMELRSETVVLDGYQFTSQDEQALHESGFKVLAFDDYGHTTHTHATWVLNQNLGSKKGWYADASPSAKLLLGSKFALLRCEFAKARTFRRKTPALARRLLVTMGGADPDNVSSMILHAIAKIPPQGRKSRLWIDVVVGSSNPHLHELQRIAEKFPHRLRLRQNIRDMTSLISRSDLAITAGGTTTWELATFGVPMIAFTIAQNQVELAKGIERKGLAINLGWPSDTSLERKAEVIANTIRNADKRQAMSRQGRIAVDGWGVTRVVGRIQSTPIISVLRATARDCKAIWRWANDPGTREVSFTKSAIPWENHRAWYRRKLTDTGCLFLVGYSHRGRRVGMIRFDSTVEGIVVSVNLAPNARGRGIGSILIRRGTEQAAVFFGNRPIMAWVLPENPASKRVFEKAGYVDQGLHVFAGRPAFRLVYGENR